MQDILQLAADRIIKFQAHAETAKSTQDRNIIEQAVFDARKEFIIIKQCFQNITIEADLVFNDVMRHIGLDLPSDHTKKADAKEEPTPVQQEVPHYLGENVRYLGAQQTAP